ncbi:isoleucine--tRNA ligase [Caenispirillum salinarum]|uniref:isoleucine--tRNA ligase n=1 Tax=Caenispirillum salinarum TaxID=859058 RepID=UPI00384FDDD9
MTKHYPEIQSSPSFPKLEEEILETWKRDKIFERSVSQRSGEQEFVFYDGPPFANGLPHYGHLVTGFVKDIIPRFQTMKGHKVDRRFGWDCHGLPAELTTEKEIGVSGRHAILDYGIGKFNAACETSVMQFTADWEYYVTRQGRWVDFENDYKTLDITFMESVLWAFKTLYEKGLVYEGHKVVPYSWAVQSPLSNFETRLDNSYREREDPAITVAFSLTPREGDKAPMKVLAWTTTPWTLPSNLALAVGPEIEYAVLEKDGEHLVIGAQTLARYKKELGALELVGTLKGSDLVGRTYDPLFPYFKDTENAFQILGAEFVDVAEGSGVVHMAPGFGEDDLIVCEQYGIPLVVPVDNEGKFTTEVPEYQGMLVFDANKPIIQDLKAQGRVIKHEQYRHNYPHCWRTDEPLIYKAINSWYVKVSAFKDRMVELNQGINWIPGHVRDGLFGKWLENARDWNISRARFWGTPLPIWKSDDPRYPRVDVYGSLDDLERDFGVRPDNLHRPYIDELTRPNPDDPTGKSTMRRVEDVFDCWFESGSMPFAQVHYPFENKEWFEDHFPGDFIVEYVAQTRGWFYTLVVLATALFDKAPFRNCMCHGVVLDENHQKLSKRLKNYPDPVEVFNTYGSDALRFYMVSSPLLVGGDLAMPKDGRAIAQTQRQVLIPLWNAYYFFTLYANAEGVKAEAVTSSENVLDRYILGKTRRFIEDIEKALEVFDIPGACAVVPPFIDTLNNWYIRRSRPRFWAENGQVETAAFNTLYTVLTTFCRAAAPLLPFLTEKIYRGLTGEESVHLADWPDASALPAEADLLETMDLVREIASGTLALRETAGKRVRLPLPELTVAVSGVERLKPFEDVIKDEVNVKTVTFDDNPHTYGTQSLHVNPKIGARIGKAMRDVMAASKKGEWAFKGDGTVEIAGQVLSGDDFSLRVLTAEGVHSQTIARGHGVVILDVETTPDLENEGLARDVIRLVQMTRKEADLHISDRIVLTIAAGSALRPALEQFGETVKRETLAVDLRLSDDMDGAHVAEHQMQGEPVKIGVAKAETAAA